MSELFDREAANVISALPPGVRLVVIGSTSFWSEDGAEFSRNMGVRFAAIAEFVGITGGMSGVGAVFGRAFSKARQEAGLTERLYHVVPKDCGPCDSGITLRAGVDYGERREILGRVGQVYVVVEGGPGTEHEASVSLRRGVPIVPIARTGGHAAELYQRMACPPNFDRTDWKLLGDKSASLDAVVSAVERLARLPLI